LTFDQLEVGREWVSRPRTLTADDLRSYSALTGDDDPAGGDPGDAPDPVGGADEAGALFGPAVATGLALDSPAVRTIAFLAIRNWQFVGRLAAGDAVRIRNRVDAVRPRGVGRRAEVEWHVEVVNQRDEVVQGGSIVRLVEGPAVPRRAAPARPAAG
jgi:acyl dehydratase